MKTLRSIFDLNPVFCNIVLVMVLTAGLMAVVRMHRELFPDFSMDEIIIDIPYPGAGPEAVQDGVILKVEQAIDGMEGIAGYSTRSEENGGHAEIMVKHGYRTTEVLDRIRSKIGTISTFPRDAEKPVITEDTHRTEVMKLYITSNRPERGLKETARLIRDELLMIDGVSQIELFGIRDDEIHVEISEARLRAYGVTFQEVADHIARHQSPLSCGVIRTDDRDMHLRTRDRIRTGGDLATVPMMAGHGPGLVYLNRLARIDDGFTDESIFVHVNGRPAVVLEVYKTRLEDSLHIAAGIKDYIREKQSRLPADFELDVLYDLTDDLKARIGLLIKNGLMGLILVMCLLWIFLELRLAFWAAVGIPVSILGALVVIWALGGTINMLSLFGLITVLGIVVDDAIVVGEAVFHHFRQGLSPPEAARAGVREVGVPVTAAVITTVLAFLPLAFIGDVIGKFLSILPLVVIPCLLISLGECLFLLPTHLAFSLKRNSKPKGGLRHPMIAKTASFHLQMRQSLDDFAQRVYLPVLKKALTYRYVALCVVICSGLWSLGVVWGGLVDFEVLPETGNTLITCSFELNPDASENQTRQAADQVEKALLTVSTSLAHPAPFIKNRMRVVGSMLSDDGAAGTHTGGVLALLAADVLQKTTTNDLLRSWESKLGDLAGARALVFESRSEGPPGEPIEIQLRGRNTDDLKAAAQDYIEELRRLKGVHQIRSDITTQLQEIHFQLKPEAGFYGVTHQDLGRQIREAFHGREAIKIQRGSEDVPIKVRYTQKERQRVETLQHLLVSTQNGSIPLTSVAHITFDRGFDAVNRVDGLRCINVTAAVDHRIADPDQIVDDLAGRFTTDLSLKYPGLFISFEGDEKHMKDALGGLYVGFPLAILGIYVIMAAMFRSYAQPFIILLTVPFGLMGGVLGHLLLGCPVSLMSLFGLVALSGVVVNDAIILIERINENLQAGLAFFEALIMAGRRRFRAIVLTTISTVGGLAPLILEKSPQAGFIIPMAISISAGLVLATVLTPVMIPCLLAILSDLRLEWRRLTTGERPERETLEPAIKRSVSRPAHPPIKGT